MQIVTGRRGEPHVTSRQMQAVYRSFLGDFALLDIGEKLRAEAYSNDIVRVYDGVVSVQGIYAVIAYNQYDEVYIEPVSVGKKRIDTIVLHYTKDNALDVEDMQLDVVQGDEYTDNPIAPVVPEGGDAWEGTTDIQVPIYDVEVTNFGLTVTPHTRMLTVIPTLDSIAERIPETVVTGVKGDSEVLYRDGDVNITKANIGLGNVDNTADTDKPVSTATQTALNLKADLVYVNAVVASAYHAGGNLTVAELTSSLLVTENMGKVYNMSDSGVTTADFVEGAGKPIREGDDIGICNRGTEENPIYKFNLLSGFVDLSAYATTSAVNAGLEGKVDKVTGKGLSTEDYTTTDKTKLAGISEGATQTIANPADTATETLSKLEVGGVVYDIPQGASGATELSELTDVNLSDVKDGDILQYDEPANKWKNSNALQGSKTTTGNPITIEDAAPVNAVNLSMDLEPIQDLHGYDHPWVGGSGKNKLNLADINITNNGSTINIEDGVLKLTGKQTDSGNWMKYKIGEITTTSEMLFSCGTPNNNWNNGFVLFVIVNGVEVTATQTGVTVPAGTYDVRVSIRYNYEINETLYPMFRATTETDPTFEPYSNICPISGRSEVEINRVGKNLSQPPQQGAHSSINGEFIPNNSYTYSKAKVVGNTQYTISIQNVGNISDVLFYDDNENFISVVNLINLPQTVTTPSNCRYLIVETGGSVTPITPSTIGDVQIELGSTATPYEPYAGKTYTIQLGDTIYGGTLDVTRGKMVVDRSKVNCNEFNFTQGVSAGGLNWYDFGAPLSIAPMSNLLPYKSNGDNGWNSTVPCLSTNGWNTLRIYGSNELFAVGGAYEGAYIVYELATPYTIQLTPQQIKMLENTNTLSSDGTMTLEYQPNNAIGEAVRAVEESYDPEFAVRPVLKKKAFSGTTDSDGAVTLINASDIPSGHKIIPLHITDMTINGSVGTYFVEYDPYNSGDSVKGYFYTYFNGSQITPVGSAVTGNFYYYELEG